MSNRVEARSSTYPIRERMKLIWTMFAVATMFTHSAFAAPSQTNLVSDAATSAGGRTKTWTLNGQNLQISFDSVGRVDSIVGPNVSARVWWDGESKSRAPVAMTLEKLDTGDKFNHSIAGGAARLSGDRQKVFNADDEDDYSNRPEFWEPLIEFALFSNMNEWAPNTTPKTCDLNACKDLCDMAGMGSGVVCAAAGAVTGGLGGVACAAGGWAVWASCRSRCSNYCK